MTIFEFMVNALYMLFSKKKQCGVFRRRSNYARSKKRKYENLRRG